MESIRTLTVQLAADRPACEPFLRRAIAYCVDGQLALEDLATCAWFEVRDGEQLVGAFALEVNTDAGGHRLRVLAAGGAPGYDVTGAIVAAVEREARERVGAYSIGCETRRPGLVKRLQAEGFEICGFILRKAIQ